MRRLDLTAPDRHQTTERLAYRVKEAAESLAISRSRFYELVAAGEIRGLKDGSRTLVRRSELVAYLDRLEEAGDLPPHGHYFVNCLSGWRQVG
jgi:excisionase family DNA binding protein